MHFDYVELIETAFNRGRPATKADVGIVDARFGTSVEHDAAPVARRVVVGQGSVGVEGPTSTVAVVGKTGENDAIARLTFRDQLRGASLKLDAGL